MARVQPSSLISDVRGKVGGAVFQRSAQGLSLRTSVTPVNPRTIAQTNSQSMLYQLQVAWLSLTAGERAPWDSWAEYQNLSTGFFSTARMTGQQAFIQLNRYRLQIGLEIITAPVFTPYTLPLYTFSISVTAGPTHRLDFFGMLDSDLYTPILRMSGRQSAARNNTSVPMTSILCDNFTDAIWTCNTQYLAAYGYQFVTGDRICVEHGVIQLNNSTLSVFTRSIYTVG